MIATHLMIDIETLGTSPRAPMISLGAAMIRDGELVASHYQTITPDLGPEFEPSYATIAWWSQQSEAARAVFTDEGLKRVGTPTALQGFEQWLGKVRGTYALPDLSPLKVWAMPPRFDIAILEHAMTVYGYTPPWGHRDILDLRAAIYLLDGDRQLAPPDGGAHNALHDAIWQAEYLVKLLEVAEAIS